MKNTLITFVHGWGCGPDIWAPLMSRLPDFQCRNVDLGFIGDADNADMTPAEHSIYVTHSLGTMWALRHRRATMRALIAINGFACFNRLTHPRILKRMHINLQRDPELQMREFWNASGLPPHVGINSGINPVQLAQGLDWLAHWDCTADLAALSCPVTSILGNQDNIANIDLMRAHWSDYKAEAAHHIIEHGGHALPLTHAQECADIIKRAVKGGADGSL